MSDDIVPSHVITPGRLQQAYQACLNQLIASDSLRRLWAKDVSLWPADERARSVGDASLGWLDLPHSLLEYMCPESAHAWIARSATAFRMSCSSLPTNPI